MNHTHVSDAKNFKLIPHIYIFIQMDESKQRRDFLRYKQLLERTFTDKEEYLDILPELLDKDTPLEMIDQLLPYLEIKQHLNIFLSALDEIVLDEQQSDCTTWFRSK